MIALASTILATKINKLKKYRKKASHIFTKVTLTGSKNPLLSYMSPCKSKRAKQKLIKLGKANA